MPTNRALTTIWKSCALRPNGEWAPSRSPLGGIALRSKAFAGIPAFWGAFEIAVRPGHPARRWREDYRAWWNYAYRLQARACTLLDGPDRDWWWAKFSGLHTVGAGPLFDALLDVDDDPARLAAMTANADRRSPGTLRALLARRNPAIIEAVGAGGSSWEWLSEGIVYLADRLTGGDCQVGEWSTDRRVLATELLRLLAVSMRSVDR